MSKQPNFFTRNIGKILSVATVITAVSLAVLSFCSVIAVNPFKIFFATLAFGFGATCVISAIPQGFTLVFLPFAVFLLSVGALILLIGVLEWYFILIIVLVGIIAIVATVAEIFILNICCSSSMPEHDYYDPATESYDDMLLRLKAKKNEEISAAQSNGDNPNEREKD